MLLSVPHSSETIMFMFHDAFLVIVGFVGGTLMTCLIMETYMRRHG